MDKPKNIFLKAAENIKQALGIKEIEITSDDIKIEAVDDLNHYESGHPEEMKRVLSKMKRNPLYRQIIRLVNESSEFVFCNSEKELVEQIVKRVPRLEMDIKDRKRSNWRENEAERHLVHNDFCVMLDTSLDPKGEAVFVGDVMIDNMGVFSVGTKDKPKKVIDFWTRDGDGWVSFCALRYLAKQRQNKLNQHQKKVEKKQNVEFLKKKISEQRSK